MSMEARHRSEGSTLDDKAHCARHRLGARGNALTFPLPWEDVLRNLQAHDARAEAARNPPQEGPTIKQSDLNEVKTKPKPVKIIESETPPKQLTASEVLQQSYNEMKRLRQQENQER